MFVPLWLIVVTLAALLVLGGLALRGRGGGGEMVERQRRANPGSTSVDRAVMASAEVRSALARGNKIEAIKLVRARTGLGLKEAKDLVEREPG